MTKELLKSEKENRLQKILSRPDCLKSPGVIKKLKRQIRNLEK